MINLICGAGFAAAACAFMIAPERPDETAKLRFAGRNYAHRGLHNIYKGIPENSLAAFRAARDLGFGVELDLQLTADGQLVVFHDNSLLRMCGVDLPLASLTYEELRAYSLAGTDEKIPLFSEVLELMDGAVPLLVELKPTRHKAQLCARALELMRTYPGELCMESFDPFIVAWFRRNAPDIVRGQLTMRACCGLPQGVGLRLAQMLILSNVITNCVARPHFIAHKLGKKTLAVRVAERMGAMRFAWTSLEPGNEAHYDSVIFEGYLPDPTYDR